MLYSYCMAFMILEGVMSDTGTHRGQEIMKGSWEETYKGRGRHHWYKGLKWSLLELLANEFP